MATSVVNSDNRPLLTIPEVAALLGISRERCYQLAAEGRIPCVRLSPRRIRVPRAALDAWLTEQAERALRGTQDDEPAQEPARVTAPPGGGRRDGS